MINIPTELLRTLIAVVEMRSFTKAAQSLGVTQPAVSAQIKRLHGLLGADLLDKSAPGVSLTPTGEAVVVHARRLLSINDQILNAAGPRPRAQMLRLGVTGDFIRPAFWQALAEFRRHRPDMRFHVRGGGSDALVREFRQGDLDLVVAMSGVEPQEDARHHWTEDMVWVRGALTSLDPSAPVPLVARGENCVSHRHVIAELERVGRSYNVVFTASRINSLTAAVAAGLGVMALARSVTSTTDLVAWDDGPLPKLPPIVCNVCVREDADGDALDELGGVLAAALRSPSPPAPTERR